MERGPGFLRGTPNDNPSVSRQLVRPAEQAAETSPVQLTYRRNVYQGRLNEAALHNVALTGVQLTYRGVSYTR